VRRAYEAGPPSWTSEFARLIVASGVAFPPPNCLLRDILWAQTDPIDFYELLGVSWVEFVGLKQDLQYYVVRCA